MNAETRAKEAVRDLLSMVAVNGSSLALAQDLANNALASALRQAENDKLEEAAACAAGAVLRGYDEGFERGDLASVAANAVRSLIQKD